MTMHQAIIKLIREYCEDYNERMRRFWIYKRQELQAIRDMKIY